MIKPKVHFIGIGGIGTSALARWFLSNGYRVSGSDAENSETIQEIKKEGIKIFISHKAGNLAEDTDLVIHTSAIPFNNPEFEKAKKLGISIKSYPQALGELTKLHKTITVSGAHGKSTTTSLLSLIFKKAGFDPTVVVGTKLKEFAPPAGGSNFRQGKSNYLVLEADEYKRAFLNYFPAAAIITNIDKEHLDCYKDLPDIKNTFLKFINNIHSDGILVANKDDKNLFSLKDKIEKITKKKNVKVFWYSINGNAKTVKIIRRVLKISGEHNVSNALAAYILSKKLGVKDKDIFSALGSYHGAWRRMEYRGKLKVKSLKLKVDVYDDYAHHPSEIKATLSGIAQKWPKTGLVCVFQPHQAKRLELLFNEFTGAFDDAGTLILLDIFRVKGRDKVSQNVNSKKLAEAVKKRINSKFKIKNLKLKEVIYLPHSKNLRSVLLKQLRTNNLKLKTIIVMMGAGDIYKMTDSLVE